MDTQAADSMPSTGEEAVQRLPSACSTTSSPTPSPNTPYDLGTKESAEGDWDVPLSRDELPESIRPVWDKLAIRQAEYYFHDDNVLTDVHLLLKLEDPDEGGVGCLSLKHLLGTFPRMRKYKPKPAVIAALKQSTVLELINDDKYIRRIIPVDFEMAKKKAKVMNEQNIWEARRAAYMEANPHVTKAEFKRTSRTGFSNAAGDDTITGEERDKNAERYDNSIPIRTRLEDAIVRYKEKRKFHPLRNKIFTHFLAFAGFSISGHVGTGGISKEEIEVRDTAEKREVKKNILVAQDVVDSIESGDGDWVVDVPAVIKGFMSTRYPSEFEWTNPENTKECCNVLRNFMKYLQLHGVMAKYGGQLDDAIAVINLVEKEYTRLVKADQLLPGAFGKACSILHGGSFLGKRVIGGDWMTEAEKAISNVGYNDEDARYILMSAIVAHCTDEQVTHAKVLKGEFKTISTEEDVGLEVTAIIPLAKSSAKAKELFSYLHQTVVPTMGKLICKRYEFPMAAPTDLPADWPEPQQNFEFIVDEETLNSCFVGMKMDVNINKLDIGIDWIDNVHKVYGSFYQWCWNEVIRDWKEPGPPTEWMKRQTAENNAYDAAHPLDESTYNTIHVETPAEYLERQRAAILTVTSPDGVTNGYNHTDLD